MTLLEELKASLENLPDNPNFTDIGHAIGLVIGKYENNYPGFDRINFKYGLASGIVESELDKLN